MDLGHRRAAFKKVIDETEARKSRAQVNNDVRKNKLLEAQMKRRNIAMAGPAEPAPAPPAPTSSFPTTALTVQTAKPSDMGLLASYVAGKNVLRCAATVPPCFACPAVCRAPSLRPSACT